MTGNKDQAGGAQARPGRSRRGLLAGAAGALGVLAAETIATAQPAAATQGNPVLLGTDNTGATARTGVFTTGNNEWAQLADPGNAGFGSQGVYGAGQHFGVRGEAGSAAGGAGVVGRAGITGGSGGGNNIGVAGFGSGAGPGVAGTGGSSGGFGVAGVGNGSGGGVAGTGGGSNGSGVEGTGGGNGAGVAGHGGGAGAGVVGNGGLGNGTGVVGFAGGNGDGVSGSGGGGSGAGVRGTAGVNNGPGVVGTTSSPGGTGVLAENTAGGIALNVLGRAEFPLYSAVLTVAAGSSSATVSGIALTPVSLVLATLQQNLSGLYVRSAVPNVAANSFTVHLSKAAPSGGAKVAFFVCN